MGTGSHTYPCVRQGHADVVRFTIDTQTTQSYRTLFDIDIYDLDVFVRLIRLVRLHILDRVHRLQPRKNAPKYRVFLVEPRRRIRSNEELGSVRVRSRVRHTHSIRPVLKRVELRLIKTPRKPCALAIDKNIPIMLQLVRELVFKFAIPNARPARAIAERVARLDHELGYHAMEEHAVVVSAPRMPNEVFDRLGSLLREETEVHVSQRRMDRSGGRKRGRTG